MKSFWNNEVKVGALVVVCGFVLFFGLNYLKGFNIFNPSNCYYARYENLDGLTVSSPVYIKGYRVGQVSEITFDFTKSVPFEVTLDIDNDIHLPQGTVAHLGNDGLLGGKCVSLLLNYNAGDYLSQEDTLPTSMAPNMTDTLALVLYPKLQRSIESMDSLMLSMNRMLNSKELGRSLKNLDSTMSYVAMSSKELEKVVQADVPQTLQSVRQATDQLAEMGRKVSELPLDSAMNNMNGTMREVRYLVERLNSEDGSLGLLLNDTSLYGNLTKTSASADELLRDMKANPKRYVHFSIFGGKNKE